MRVCAIRTMNRRAIHGGSDAALVIDLIVGRSVPCIERKTDLSAAVVTQVLDTVRCSLTMTEGEGPCDECATLTVVHRLG